MKNYISGLLAVIWLLLGTGCMAIFPPADEPAESTPDALLSELLNAVKSNDAAAGCSLFAEAARRELGDMTQEVTDLMEYLQGNDFLFECTAGPTGREDRENGEYRKTETTGYEIFSEAQTYRLAMRSVTVDTAQPENVGIWSLSVIRADEDPSPEYSYVGDATYRTGIFIGATFAPVIVGDFEKAGQLSVETVTILLNAVSGNDFTEAEKQFAKDAVHKDEEFRKTWDELHRYFGDGYTEIRLDSVESAESGLDDDGLWRETGVVSFLVTTIDGVYQIGVCQVYYNSANANDIGLWSLEITQGTS